MPTLFLSISHYMRQLTKNDLLYRLELEKEHKKSTSMDSQGQTTSLHRLQNVEKRIVKVLEFAVGVMDELASPIVGGLLNATCGNATELIIAIFALRRIVYEGEDGEEEEVVIGLWSGIAWLVGMTVFIVVLSEYVVDTIEEIDDISLAVALGSATQIAMFVALAYLLSLPEMKNGGIDPNQKSDSNSRVYIACFNDVLIQLLFSLLNFDQNL
ncbi:hypothetical protein JHK87_052245 [Glycine soja]|nr:hypothetical protein JHK87_052245 [Glycine soja]